MYMCVFACMFKHTYMHKCVCTHACVFAHVSLHVHVCLRMHTHASSSEVRGGEVGLEEAWKRRALARGHQAHLPAVDNPAQKALFFGD